jgi:PBP1b-binding outer membrane lipoprotein LpoB
MKYLLILSVLFLAGCSTVTPVKQKFPEPPGKLSTEKCNDLEKIADGASLTEISKTISKNYTSYYECAIKLEAWNEWYREQKQISDTLNK